MSKCIKCGSYVSNLHQDDIDQGSLCDVHYWQGRAHRAEAKLEQGEPVGQLLEEAFGRGQVMWFNKPKDESMLYTTPQQRKPLTDDELYEIVRAEGKVLKAHAWEIVQNLQAKLKEKNT